MKHIKINPWLYAVILISYLTHNLSSFLWTYFSLLFHETVHLYFLSRKKILVHHIILEPFGICIETENAPPQGVTVYLCAPIANLLVASFLWVGYHLSWFPFYEDCFFSNLFLGIINLLPCLPLDGGRTLFYILKKKMTEKKARNLLQIVSLLLSILLMIVGVWLFQKRTVLPSLFIIGVFLCYTALTNNQLLQKKSVCEAFRRADSRLLSAPVPVVSVAVSKDYPARKLLSYFQGETYYTVMLISQGQVIKTLTETQILDKILHEKVGIRLSECG